MSSSFFDSVNKIKSLNPYSTGRYSVSNVMKTLVIVLLGLNPYSTGRYSVRSEIADRRSKKYLS